MGTVFDDLRQIQTRPGMYIGSNRVSDLFTFLTGYRMALWEEPGRRLHTQNGLPLGYFGYHLAQKYRRSASMGWANLLLELTGSEEAGLAQFFVELEEFKALFLQRVQEPILTQEARRYRSRTSPGAPRGHASPTPSASIASPSAMDIRCWRWRRRRKVPRCGLKASLPSGT